MRYPSRPPLPSRRHTGVTAALVLALMATACGGPDASPSPAATATPVAVVPTPTPTPTPTPSPSPSPSPTPSPTPATEPADLTGLPVDPAVAHRLPLAVMIGDNRKARPQSGFNAASIVYQAPADGFETRYLFIYGADEARDIGPVRSARFYLVQWSQEVRAAIAHYGGDRRTRSYIRGIMGRYGTEQFTDVDGLGRGRKAFHRIKARKAPDNAYTSTADVRRMADKLGAPELLDPEVFRRPFRDPSPVEARGTAQSIRVPYRTNVITYAYDSVGNRYLRSVDGKAQIDPADDRRVTTTNIVILFQKYRIDTKIEKGHARPVITTLGSGKAWIINEGRLVKGTWRKKTDGGPTRLYDADGHEIALVRGRTFFQVVPPGTKVRVTD